MAGVALPWELHKETIQYLYLSEKQTLKKVMDLMRTQHDFKATKNQYERQFKKWNFSKYTPKGGPPNRWRTIGEKYRRRKREGKESDIFVHGELVSRKKVLKEIARPCNFVTTVERYQSASSPRTPEGMLVCTPPPFDHLVFLLECIWPLPCIRFQTRFFRQASPRTDGSSAMSPKSADFGHTGIDLTINVPRGSEFDIKSLLGHSGDYGRVAAFIPPADYDIGDVLTPVGLSRSLTKSDSVHLLKLAIYVLCNKLGDSHSGPRKAFEQLALDWCRRPGNLRHLETLLSTREPTVEAFAEAMLSPALESEDEKLVRILLSSVTEIDHRILEIPVSKRNVKLTELILLNSLSKCKQHSSALNFAFHRAVSLEHIDLVCLLLEAGAKFKNNSLLISSIRKGNFDITRLLLYAGADVNQRTWLRELPLEVAVECQDYQVVQNLLANGADANSLHETFSSALEMAIEMNDKIMFDLLRQAGAPFDSDQNARGVLPVAVAGGNTMLIETLLEEGANVNAEDCSGEIALTKAIKNDDMSMFRYLLSLGADINGTHRSNASTPLEAAIRTGKDNIVQEVINSGANIDGRALFQAMEMKILWLIHWLLDRGTDIDISINGHTPLTKAISFKDCQVVNLLLEYGAHVNEPGPRTPLAEAVRASSTTLTKKLLHWGASPIDRGALAIAVEKGNIPMLEILFQAISTSRHAYDKADLYNPAILEAAVIGSESNIIRALVRAGCNLNLRYRYNEDIVGTPLELASEMGHISVVHLLLELGARPNIPFESGPGISAAARAARRSRMDIVQLLLHYHADLNGAPCSKSYEETAPENNHTEEGNRIESDLSALQCAVRRGNSEMVQFLLASGANVEAPLGLRGLSALHLAATEGYIEIANILLSAGATTTVDAVSSGYEWERLYDTHLPVRYYRFHRTRTALELASEYGRIDMVQLLLNAGAALDLPRFHKDDYGNNDSGGHISSVKDTYCNSDEVPSDEGLDPEWGLPCSTQYEIAMNLAKRYGHGAITRLLTAYKEEVASSVL